MTSTDVAKSMLVNLQRGFPRTYEIRQVDGSQFRHVSQAFYTNRCHQLGELGFRMLGDIEDVTAKRAGGFDVRTFLRLMTDKNHTTVSASYFLAPKFAWKVALWLMRIPVKVVEFESYSGNEHAHCTTVMPSKITVPRPNTITKDNVPRGMSLFEMYQRHCETIAQLPQPLRQIRSVTDAINLQVRQHALLREHMEAIGWLTKDYIRAQGVATESTVDEIYEIAQQLLKDGFSPEH